MNDNKLNECKTVFDIFDKDQDGKISKKKLVDIIRILGTYHSKNDLEKINETLKSDLILMMNFYKFLKKFIQRKKVKMI
jgi:Ca2+-binding EF-hand superfamily protein